MVMATIRIVECALTTVDSLAKNLVMIFLYYFLLLMSDPFIATVLSVNYTALLEDFLWINLCNIIAKVLRGILIISLLILQLLLLLKLFSLLILVDFQRFTL